MSKRIEVTARQARRCRGDHCFTTTPRYFDEGYFSEKTLTALKADPLLNVREVDEDEIKDLPPLEGKEADAALVVAAIRLLTPEQFDGTGLPRMPDLRAALKLSSPDLAARFDTATRDRILTGMKNEGFVVPLASTDNAPSEAGGYDTLIEEAIRAFGPDDFTKGGKPRMDRLRNAVQKLAYPNGEEAGVIIEAEDCDRVFKAMVAANFEVPKVVTGNGGT